VREYAAGYDRTTKIVSAIVTVVLLAAMTFGRLGFLGPLILLIAYAYSPRGYAVSDNSLIVRRWVGDVRIPLNMIREVSIARNGELSGALRLWGSGALFGYYGLFRTTALGNSWWYLTNRANCVVIKTTGKTFVVSPNDVDGFVAALNAGSPSVIPRTEPKVTSRGIPKILAIAAMLLPLGIVAAAWFYSPGAPGYTLTPDHLAIHDRFYPVTINAASVNLPDIKIVDVKQDPEWRPDMRTGGFANPHYRSGWFRVKGGEKVRLYQANSSRLVLIPPKGNGTPVLYQAAEPEQFIAELQREWKPGSSR
jgi:hypothetical protein